MKERRNIWDLFKKEKSNQTKTFTTFKELGSYNSCFSIFGGDIYSSDDVRCCIRALSAHTSKANPKSTNSDVERILSLKPNKYMNGKAMLEKLRNILEIKNTAFLYIERDNANKVIGFYPVPFSSFEGMEYEKRMFVKFQFDGNAIRSLVLPWEDLAILRKDYVYSDIGGESNRPLIPTLDVVNTMDQGLKNAVKSTSNLRGILKSTKAMLSDEDIKKNKERFVRDYMTLENNSGIASLDSTQEFKEINLKPTTATAEEADGYRERIYRYYGVNKKIITSDYNESEYDAFYESRIEPFLVDLSLELTRKIFTDREISFGNKVWFEANRLQFASVKTKLGCVALVDRGLMTPNEFREVLNLPPYDGGDEFVLRLDTAKTGDSTDSDKSDSTEGDKEDGN